MFTHFNKIESVVQSPAQDGKIQLRWPKACIDQICSSTCIIHPSKQIPCPAFVLLYPRNSPDTVHSQQTCVE